MGQRILGGAGRAPGVIPDHAVYEPAEMPAVESINVVAARTVCPQIGNWPSLPKVDRAVAIGDVGDPFAAAIQQGNIRGMGQLRRERQRYRGGSREGRPGLHAELMHRGQAGIP